MKNLQVGDEVVFKYNGDQEVFVDKKHFGIVIGMYPVIEWAGGQVTWDNSGVVQDVKRVEQVQQEVIQSEVFNLEEGSF
jgi:hypothetical protein